MINFGEAEESYEQADGFVLSGGVGIVETAHGVPEFFANMGPFLGLNLGISFGCDGCRRGEQCTGWEKPQDLNLLIGAMGLAVLAGQAAAVLELLPVDVRDQAAAAQQEAGRRLREALKEGGS